jgi:hypothetical protein
MEFTEPGHKDVVSFYRVNVSSWWEWRMGYRRDET